MDRKLTVWALAAVVLVVAAIWAQGVLQSTSPLSLQPSSPSESASANGQPDTSPDPSSNDETSGEDASSDGSAASSSSSTSDRSGSADSSASNDASFDRLREVYQTIQSNFYDPQRISHQTMETEAIRGLISTLDDPYSRYNTPEEYERFQSGLSGEYEGIGAWIGIRDEQIVIISPIDGGPAKAAGIRTGDAILAIDGESTEGFSVDDAAQRLRGPAGTDVTVEIRREDGSVETITITRDHIKVPSTDHELLSEDIAYVSINRFARSTPNEVKTALDELQSQSPDIQGLVLDLRGNGGGYLQAAIQIASLFVERGEPVVKVRERGDRTETSSSFGNDVPNWPIAVLVDNGTASAAEILAGAIRDHQMGTLIGRTTFGKGVVQSGFNTSGGGMLFLTTAQYFTPDGHKVHDVGLTPPFKIDDWFTSLQAIRQEIVRLRDSLPSFADSAQAVLQQFNDALTDVQLAASEDEYADAVDALDAFRELISRDPAALLGEAGASSDDPQAVLLPPLLEELRSSLAPKLDELERRLNRNPMAMAQEWLGSSPVAGARCPCEFISEPAPVN